MYYDKGRIVLQGDFSIKLIMTAVHMEIFTYMKVMHYV